MKFETLIEIFYAHYHERVSVFPTNGTDSEKQDWQLKTLDMFRIQLEPFVYQYLEAKYGTAMDKHWATHTFPKTSSYALVIVERRCHPNWNFILKNAAWAAPYCSLYIFCSDLNEAVVRSYLGEKADNVHIIPWFKGSATREEGRAQTNLTFKSADFYRHIDAAYMLRFEMDTYFLQKVPYTIFKGDFYGAPWAWALDRPGGGGLTIRKCSALIDVCEKEQAHADTSGEDSWIADAILKHGYSVPSLEFRLQVFLENAPSPTAPIGIHQFWTFLMNFGIQDRVDFEQHVRALVTLNI
jgi:hypothetical protein